MASTLRPLLEEGRIAAVAAWGLAAETFHEWSDDDATRLAASLAYYTTFSIAPLLVVVIALAGLLFGREAVQGEIVHQVAAVVGRDGGKAIQELIANASKPASSVAASVVGFVVLLFGASGVVAELKASLNKIWDVPPAATGLMALLRERLLSFALVLGVGFVLLVSLAINTALAAAGSLLRGDAAQTAVLWMAVTFVVTLAIETGLFSLMFKVLPDTEVAWADVWIGAMVTAALFELGKLVVGIYLGQAGIASAYGAAGSLVVVLVWVYYSAQLLFLGAEFTHVYARRHGRARPSIPAARARRPLD